MDIRRLTPGDLPRLKQFWIEHWDGETMFTRGELHQPDQLEGFVIEDAEEWIGLLTLVVNEQEMEIISLDSLREAQGFGSLLLKQAIDEAHARNCQRIVLSTTNDNLNALRFYQKRGFKLSALHCGAVNEARKIKPGIPLIGENDIPLRDEIELEMVL